MEKIFQRLINVGVSLFRTLEYLVILFYSENKWPDFFDFLWIIVSPPHHSRRITTVNMIHIILAGEFVSSIFGLCLVFDSHRSI